MLGTLEHLLAASVYVHNFPCTSCSPRDILFGGRAGSLHDNSVLQEQHCSIPSHSSRLLFPVREKGQKYQALAIRCMVLKGVSEMFQRGVKPTRNFIHCPYGNGGFSLFSIILPEIGRKKKKNNIAAGEPVKRLHCFNIVHDS